MPFRVIAIVLFLVVVSGGLLVHFRQQSLAEKPPPKASDADEIPVPPKTGPYGKLVVVGKATHDFGVMEQGQSGEYEFKIRNEGQAPLKLVSRNSPEDHSCQCTLGSLNQNGLQPGEETTVKLSWTIKSPITKFDHWAKIRSDDPDNLVTTFRVRGLVGKRLVVKPNSEINIDRLSETEPTTRVVTLHSETLDHFDIEKVETSNPLISVTTRPLHGEELKKVTRTTDDERMREMEIEMMKNADTARKMQEMQDKMLNIDRSKSKAKGKEGPPPPDDELAGKMPDAKCAYELLVTIQPGFPVGKFRESMLVYNTVPDHSPLIVWFEGVRTGPVQILATPGILWSGEDSIMRMGRFPAAEGKTARLLVFIKKVEQELEVKSIKVDPPFVQCRFQKDPNFKGVGRDKFDLFVEVPKGQLPVSILGEGSRGFVAVETNHPEAGTIKFELEFSSY